MITKEELNKIVQSAGLSLYQQEKDYLLKLFLYYYYQKHREATFKGGTCLKYLLGIPRFSEDLDFNIKKVKTFQEQVRRTLQSFGSIGITYYFLKEEEFTDSYTCEIGFEGPLFTGDRQTQNKFRIDAGYRTGTFRKPEWKIIKSEYPETTENFLALVMDYQEILVEKIIALVNRRKGRDLYDVWFMIQTGVALDKSLLQQKAKKEKVKLDLTNICSRQEYERDMSKLTNRMIPYEQVHKDITKFLNYFR